MFTSLSSFEKHWQYESQSTSKILKALTDTSLNQQVSPEDRTLGRIAWHIIQTIPEMLGHTGLKVAGPSHEAPVPNNVAEIQRAYTEAAESLLTEVKKHWTDETLLTTDNMYGETWPRGFTLSALICHEVHHRGQLTVLMRQAGVSVPGVYGPAREEWQTMGMQAPAI